MPMFQVEFADMETPPSAPPSDLSDEPLVSLNTDVAKPKPTPSSPLFNPPGVKKKKKPMKKNRGGRRLQEKNLLL